MVSIIALGVAVSVPLIAESVRTARIRAAAEQFVYSLRAARMIAVSKRAPLTMTVVAHPGNFYSYEDAYSRTRRTDLPDGARISSTTSATVEFQPNGSIAEVGHTAIFESGVVRPGGVFEVSERWTVTTNVIGVTNVSHETLP